MEFFLTVKKFWRFFSFTMPAVVWSSGFNDHLCTIACYFWPELCLRDPMCCLFSFFDRTSEVMS